jgi:LuxR family transcriptional regulator, quorum-sensing system regulator SdiA
MSNMNDIQSQFHKVAPAGFYAALRVGFSFAEVEMNQLPKLWVDFYATHGLLIHDPAMAWVYTNTGAIRLAEIEQTDPQQVLAQAALFGLVHGAVVSVLHSQDRGRRSYGVFFREDRDFTAAELQGLERQMQQLHEGGEPSLTTAEIAALTLQSQGMRLRQIGVELGITESAVKARLNNVKRKLGARTQSQAASIAAARRIL